MESNGRIDLSSLIDDTSKAQQAISQTQLSQTNNSNVPQMKKISLKNMSAAGLKRTYRQASELCFTAKTRPLRTLEQVSEMMKQKRFKRYTPQEREYPAYEPREFAKQMDVEIMSIKVNEASLKKNQNKMIPRYYRTVVRRVDEQGKFKWLAIELEEMGQQYSVSQDEIMTLFE